jgi:pentatricopeptide repeat protein
MRGAGIWLRKINGRYQPDFIRSTTYPFSYSISSEFDPHYQNLLKQQLFREAEIQLKNLLRSPSCETKGKKGFYLETKNYHGKYFGLLLSSLARAAEFETCDRIRSEMISEHHLIPNVICYNIIINSLCKSMNCDRSLEILQEMRSHGLPPDLYSYSPILHAYLLQSKPDHAFDLINQMKQSNISPSVGVYNSLIRSFIRENKPEKVTHLVIEMTQQEIYPAKPMLLALLNSFYNLNRPKDAESFLSQLQLLSSPPKQQDVTTATPLHELLADIRTYHMLMKSYINSSLPLEAERVLLAILSPESEYSRLGVVPLPQTFTILMDGYTSGGHYDHTDRIFELLLSQSPTVEPDVICYTNVMERYYKAGRYADVINTYLACRGKVAHDVTCVNVYLKALQARDGAAAASQLNLSFDPLMGTDSYNTLIHSAVEKSHPEQGEILLRSMTTTNLKPNVITYSTLIHGYTKCGLYQDAQRLYIEMLSNAITPNEVTFHSLITMSCHSDNVSQALQYLHEMEHDHHLTPLIQSYHELLAYYSSKRDLPNTEKLFSYLKSHPSLGPLDLRSYKYLLKLYETKKLFVKRNQLRRELDEGLKSGSVVIGRC